MASEVWSSQLTERRLICLEAAMAALALVGAGAFGDLCKLEVDRTGMHSVTGAELAAAGLELAAIDPSSIGLRNGKATVAVRVLELKEGELSPTSRIVFYGEAIDTRYTGTNVYWLSWDGTHVARMTEIQPTPGVGEPARSFPASIHLEENNLYAYLLYAPDAGELRPWFWGEARSDKPLTVSFDLPQLAGAEAPAALRVLLRGRSRLRKARPDHHVVVELNGLRIGEAVFDGQEQALIQQPIPPGTLLQLKNALTVASGGDDSPAAERDRVYLDWVEVDFRHDLALGESAMLISRPEDAESVEISVPDGDALDWYDLTDPARPSVSGNIPVVDGRARIGLGPDPSARYAAVPAGGYLTVAHMSKAPDPYLKQTREPVDYLIIAHDSLLDAIQPLATYRGAQGLRVRVAPVSQVYNEFSDGIFTPVAIREFLAFACREWPAAPRYVLLVGDATCDYRDYAGTGFACLVPSMMVRERGGIEVAADRAFAALDPSPAKVTPAVGRFPARTEAQVRYLVERTIAFEKREAPPGTPRRIILAADQEGFGATRGRFSGLCDSLAEKATASGLDVRKVYQTDVGLTEEMGKDECAARTREELTPKLVEALRQGADLVFFTGHGDESFWGYFHMLEVGDLAVEEIGSPGICIQDTCFAGAFDVAGGEDCLAEALLWSGACAATYAPSRLGGHDVQIPLLKALIDGRGIAIGDLLLEFQRGKALVSPDGRWASGVNFNLLGDPALHLGGVGSAPDR